MSRVLWYSTASHGMMAGEVPRGVEEYLTVNEAASRLKVDPETVRVWLRRGKLQGTILSRAAGWRIAESEVERILRGEPGKEAA
jgi:excisionase family DNA binding protein